jgi:hypothetical protein
VSRLPPMWLRDRTPEERARERAHLAAMEKREREAIAQGMQCRPKVRAFGDGVAVFSGGKP